MLWSPSQRLLCTLTDDTLSMLVDLMTHFLCRLTNRQELLMSLSSLENNSSFTTPLPKKKRKPNYFTVDKDARSLWLVVQNNAVPMAPVQLTVPCSRVAQCSLLQYNPVLVWFVCVFVWCVVCLCLCLCVCVTYLCSQLCRLKRCGSGVSETQLMRKQDTVDCSTPAPGEGHGGVHNLHI